MVQNPFYISIRIEPWITQEILGYIKERDHFLYLFKKHGNEEDYKYFCKMRNQVQKEIRKAKSSFFSNKIEESKNGSKGLWQHLKDLGYKGDEKGKSNIVLNIDGENCHEAEKIANHFNSFFTNIASLLVQRLPKPKFEFDADSEIFKIFYKEKNSKKYSVLLKVSHRGFCS